jgi:nucleolar protein 58
MFVLFETPAGFALFKVLDQGKLTDAKTIEKNFLSSKKAQGLVKLKSFEKFENTTDATKAAAELVEGKLGDSLKGFLKKELKVIIVFHCMDNIILTLYSRNQIN